MAEATCAQELPARVLLRQAGPTDGETDGRRPESRPRGRAVGEMPGPPALLPLLLLLAAGSAGAAPLPQTGAGEPASCGDGAAGIQAAGPLRRGWPWRRLRARSGVGAEESERLPWREARGSARLGRFLPQGRGVGERVASPGPKRGRGDAVGAGEGGKRAADRPLPG